VAEVKGGRVMLTESGGALHGWEDRAKLTPDPGTNARTREEAMRDWVARIAAGETMRGAAVPVRAKHGLGFGQLKGYAERDPEGWGALLEDAIATKIEAVEATIRRAVMAEPGDISEDPGTITAKTTNARWLLSKWDRENYGDAKRVEQSGPGGGPIHTASVVRYELHAPANALIGDDPDDA
jgi:hypothetical protein